MGYFAIIFFILYDFTFSFHTVSLILYFSAGAREVIFISCVPIFTSFLSNNSIVITILVFKYDETFSTEPLRITNNSTNYCSQRESKKLSKEKIINF